MRWGPEVREVVFSSTKCEWLASLYNHMLSLCVWVAGPYTDWNALWL